MANEDKQNGIMSYSFGKPMAVEEEKAFSWYKDKVGMQQDTPPYRKNPQTLYKPSAWESMPDIKQVIEMYSSQLLNTNMDIAALRPTVSNTSPSSGISDEMKASVMYGGDLTAADMKTERGAASVKQADITTALTAANAKPVAEERSGLMARRDAERMDLRDTRNSLVSKPRVDSIESHDARNKPDERSAELKALEIPEGFRKDVYILPTTNSTGTMTATTHKSGLTFATGVDVGQSSRKELLDMGIPSTIVNKLESWIGLNPDTITDEDGNTTGAPALKTARDTARDTLSALPENASSSKKAKAQSNYEAAQIAYTNARTKGHALMQAKFSADKASGSLPKFTDGELYETQANMWKKKGVATASENYGRGFKDLPRDVQYVLSADAYHKGSVDAELIAAARRDGATGASVAAAMPDSWAQRRTNVIDSLKFFNTDPEK